MADSKPVQRLYEFLRSVESARFDEFRTRSDANVESANAFEEMRRHILTLYEGVEAQHWFVENGGEIVDCIPTEQQPSLRNSGQRILSPPPMPEFMPGYDESPGKPAGQGEAMPVPPGAPPPQLHPDYRDRFGNQMWCPAGTIPMVRVTLEQVGRFRTLRDFLRKAPARLSPSPPGKEGGEEELDMSAYRHAIARQFVNNAGGRSIINVWNPPLGPNHRHSISQIWIVGGSGGSMQTVECGWRVYPGSVHPRLFIYWTRDNYTSTGCYDLTCTGFVKREGTSVIGAALATSQPSFDRQMEYQMGFFLAQGAWWFYVSGEAVGYYPASLFGSGALASHAHRFECGGEVNGNGSWPPMGSGAVASGGLGRAAYQRDIVYSPVEGGLRMAHLTEDPVSPCYSIFVHNFASGWNSHVFFGGPGGTAC